MSARKIRACRINECEKPAGSEHRRHKMGVLITNQQNLYRLSTDQVRQTAMYLLDALGRNAAELSLLIVDDEQISGINKTYLGRAGPTNVIAFPMGESGFGQDQPELLGDVVISVETARREAFEAGYTTAERFTELLIHGILHLLGYDHETDEKDARLMSEKSDELMAHLRENMNGFEEIRDQFGSRIGSKR